jgi:hypothetical protein
MRVQNNTHEFLLHEHSTSVLMHAVQWGTVYALHMQVADMYMAACACSTAAGGFLMVPAS